MTPSNVWFRDCRSDKLTSGHGAGRPVVALRRLLEGRQGANVVALS